MTRNGYDRWSPSDSPKFSIVGDDDFTPLRGPRALRRREANQETKPETARKPTVRARWHGFLDWSLGLPPVEGAPGFRKIDGEWFYSARWLP